MRPLCERLFKRTEPRSLVHVGAVRFLCACPFALMLTAALAGIASAYTLAWPHLRVLDRDALPAALGDLSTALPEDLRIVFYRNASTAVNRALPYSLSLLGAESPRELRRRVVFESALEPAMLRRKYASGDAQTVVDWVVSGPLVFALDRAALALGDRSLLHGSASKALPQLRYALSALYDPVVEAGLAVFCEPMSLGALSRTLELERTLKLRARDGGYGGGGMGAAAAAQARKLIQGLPYYNESGMEAAAAAGGFDDVVSHRLVLLAARLMGALPPDAGSGAGAGDTTTADPEAGDAGAAAGANGGWDWDDLTDWGNDDSDGDGMPQLTSSYVCTRHTVAAAAGYLQRNPLIHLHPRILFGFFAYIATCVELFELAAFCNCATSLSAGVAFLLLRAAWRRGRGEPPVFGHLVRIAAVLALGVSWVVRLLLWLEESLPPAVVAAVEPPVDLRNFNVQLMLHCALVTSVSVAFYDPDTFWAPPPPQAAAAGAAPAAAAAAAAVHPVAAAAALPQVPLLQPHQQHAVAAAAQPPLPQQQQQWRGAGLPRHRGEEGDGLGSSASGDADFSAEEEEGGDDGEGTGSDASSAVGRPTSTGRGPRGTAVAALLPALSGLLPVGFPWGAAPGWPTPPVPAALLLPPELQQHLPLPGPPLVRALQAQLAATQVQLKHLELLLLFHEQYLLQVQRGE